MAQRVHDCPGCGEAVVVPDHYFDRLIACPHCQTPMDRRTGEGAGKANPPAPQPQPARAQHPPQQYPYPSGARQPGPHPYPRGQQRANPYPAPPNSPYPYPGAQYAPPRKRGFPRWAIVSILVGVLCVGGFVGLMVFAVKSIEDAKNSVTSDREDWVTYEDPEGRFTALFPGNPQLSNQTLHNGVHVNETAYKTPATTWEVSCINLSRDHVFSFESGLASLAEKSGREITTSRQKRFRGSPGWYGEVDNGWYKAQMFRVGYRVWLIGAGFNTDDFEYFLDNVKFSDATLGVIPLKLEFHQVSEFYEGASLPDAGARAQVLGGRAPYEITIEGGKDLGLRFEPQSGGFYRLAGAPRKAATRDVDFVVEDADGRTESVRHSLVVHARPDPIYELKASAIWGGGRINLDPSNAGTLDMEVGRHLTRTLDLRSRMTGYDVEIDKSRTSIEGAPEWLDVKFGNYAIHLAGTPSRSETREMSIKGVVHAPAGGLEDRLSLTLTLDVHPVPRELQDRALPDPAPLAIAADVGRSFSRSVRYAPDRPSGWGSNRGWRLSGEWHTDGIGWPDGIHAEAVEDGDDAFPVIQLGGIPEQSGEWDLEIKATVRADYISEARDIVQKLKLIVRPVHDDLIPDELNVASGHFHFDFDVSEEASVSAPKLHIRKPVRWSRSRMWSYAVEWDTDDAELPEGLRFEMRETEDEESSRLHVVGIPEKAGVWEFELKGKIRIRFLDRTYDISRKVKITVE